MNQIKIRKTETIQTQHSHEDTQIINTDNHVHKSTKIQIKEKHHPVSVIASET